MSDDITGWCEDGDHEFCNRQTLSMNGIIGKCTCPCHEEVLEWLSSQTVTG